MSGTKKEHIDLSDWSLWSNHVLIELKRLNSSIDDLRKDLTQVTVEVVQLKVKSSLWGAVSGAITVLMIFAIGWVKGEVGVPTNQPQNSPIYYSLPVSNHQPSAPGVTSPATSQAPAPKTP